LCECGVVVDALVVDRANEDIWAVHRLEQEPAEVEILEALWCCGSLWVDQLEVIARGQHQVGASLGTDAGRIHRFEIIDFDYELSDGTKPMIAHGSP
jgi:hypothetical protein